MHFMYLRFLLGTLLTSSVAFSGNVQAQVQTNLQPMIRADARERVPTALMGVWKANIAASSYPGNPPREHLRAFQYTAGGKLMVMFFTLGATGNSSFGHWAVQLGGAPADEYFSSNGSTVFAEVTLKESGPTIFNVSEIYQGKIIATGTYKLEENGQRLTLDRISSDGSRTKVVYNRWESVN